MKNPDNLLKQPALHICHLDGSGYSATACVLRRFRCMTFLLVFPGSNLSRCFPAQFPCWWVDPGKGKVGYCWGQCCSRGAMGHLHKYVKYTHKCDWLRFCPRPQKCQNCHNLRQRPQNRNFFFATVTCISPTSHMWPSYLTGGGD